jgi:hypothetical protein
MPAKVISSFMARSAAAVTGQSGRQRIGNKNLDFKMKSEVAEGNLTSKRSQRLLSYPNILGLGFTLSAKLYAACP